MKRFLGVSAAISVAMATFIPHGALAAGKPAHPAGKATGKDRAAAAHAANALRKVPGEVIVRYASGADRSQVRDETGTDLVERLALPRTELVETDPADVAATIAALEASDEVLFAEPNYYVHAAALPNDPKFKQNWGLHNSGQLVGGITGSSGTDDADIDAPEAWDVTTGSRNVVVAIADSGVAYNHPDLAANIWTNSGETGSGREANGADDDGNGHIDDWRGWDFIDNDNDPADLLGHGTHVAGTVGAAGNDGFGTTGVAWNVSLMPLRVLGADGAGTTAHVTSAITYAAAKGADVINLSLGGPDYSTSVNAAITAAPELLVVTAAGNEGQNVDVVGSYPCNYPAANIICVGSTDQNDQLSSFSNYGTNVDLAAPGERIYSTVPAFVRPLRESFETDISTRWVSGGSGHPWGRGLDAVGYYGADSPDTTYLPNSDTWLQTAAPMDLTGLDNCTLTYLLYLDTESGYDFFTTETSTDGATWDRLGRQISGHTKLGWLSRSEKLTTNGPVYLRFRLTSNAAIEKDGASIDDVNVRCLTPNYVGNEYSYYNGTSMATPHVAGAAAIVMSAAPDATVTTVTNALLTGTDFKEGLVGKTSAAGRLNVVNALQVVVPNQIPTTPTSPAPAPTETATPAPKPTDEPTPEPTDEPTPEPTPTVEAPATVEHARTISLKLVKHLRVTGLVTAANDLSACINSVTVKIKRNGKLVKTIKTSGSGTFVTKVRDRAGRYVAIAPRLDVADESCSFAKSPMRKHRHS